MLPRRILLTTVAGLPLARVLQAADVHAIAIAVSSSSFVLGGERIGEQTGLFTRNGLAPRIIVMDSGSAGMSALLGGSAQFAATGPSEALAARARGQDVVVVANLYAGLAGFVVLSKAAAAVLKSGPDAPVAARLKALDGLLLAVPSATSALLGPVRTAAEEAGARVRFTYMAQGAMPAALENKAVDGIVAAFPFAGTPILRGTGVLWIDGPGAELPAHTLPSSSSCLVTAASYAKANPDIVRRLRQAIVDIAGFIEKDPAAAKQALAAGYAQLSAEEVALAYDRQWRNWTKPFLTQADMAQELKLLKASVKLPGLDDLDASAALLPGASP